MNAMTPFTLEAQPSGLLSRLDLSDAENVRDAAAALRRCSTDADYVRWAREWGDALVRRAEATEGHEDLISDDDLRQAEADAEGAEKSRDELKVAIERAETALDRLSGDFDLGSKLSAAIDVVINGLEAARMEA